LKRSPRQIILLFLVFVCQGAAARAQSTTPPLPLPSPFRYVNDYAGVIDAATKSRLETILSNLDKQQKIQFAVVTVKTTGDQDIFNYSLALARGWGIGNKDTSVPSLLLLVATDDHKYRTEVSRHLEGDLPDGLVGQIQRDKLVPAFKQGQYGQGVFDTMQAYISTLASKRGFTITGIDQSNGYRQPPRQVSGSRRTGFSPCLIVFVIVIIVIFLIASRGHGGGCLSLFLLGSLFNSGRGSDSGGWGGGGFGGSDGGGGGFGGGGDFGGGGAGGSW
jgi:uncharacterized protein